MPKRIEIRRDRLGAYITIDGEDLPADWFADASVHLGVDRSATVTLTLLAETVIVVDSAEVWHGEAEGQATQKAAG